MNHKPVQFDLLLTALTPISHHDPAITDGSNTLTFNRQKQYVRRSMSVGRLAQEQIAAFCEANPVPLSLVDVFSPLRFSEFAACALTRTLIDIYNSQDGTGLFEGIQRYTMLENRLRSAAIRSSTLPRLWSLVTKDLFLPIHSSKYDEQISRFFSLPAGVQESVISVIVDEFRSVVTIARVWSQHCKTKHPEYAQKTGQPVLDGMDAIKVLRFNAEDLVENHTHFVVEMPAISSNSLRHQLVRRPGWEHLVGILDLDVKSIPVAAEAIFVNGGNIRAGAKQPQNSFGLAQKIRDVWPLLDLLGGVTDSFDLGESRLSVSNWLVCRENADALVGYDLPGLAVSAFDLLDDTTHTRQATDRGEGQMIWNFETLAKGTQILVRFTLSPFTSELTRGCLAVALEEFVQRSAIAGQFSRGFGVVTAENIGGSPDDWQGNASKYIAYLIENSSALRGWLIDGTLGCGTVVVS